MNIVAIKVINFERIMLINLVLLLLTWNMYQRYTLFNKQLRSGPRPQSYLYF